MSGFVISINLFGEYDKFDEWHGWMQLKKMKLNKWHCTLRDSKN